MAICRHTFIACTYTGNCTVWFSSQTVSVADLLLEHAIMLPAAEGLNVWSVSDIFIHTILTTASLVFTNLPRHD